MKCVWKKTILTGLFCAVPALSIAQSASQPDEAGVREAIRFERAKDAADARQARLEARHPSDMAKPGSPSSREDGGLVGNRVGDPGELGASRSEHSKSGGGVRQAQPAGQHSSTGAADRQMQRKQ